MSPDDGLFLWVALVSLCALALSSWAIVEGVYLSARIWRSFRSWWLYGRHGAAYRRSVNALARRSNSLKEASRRFGALRFGRGNDERR